MSTNKINDTSEVMTEGFLSNITNKFSKNKTNDNKGSNLNKEIENLKKLKAEGKIDQLQYTQKVAELTNKYSQMVNDLKVESSTEKKILDRDAKVGEIDKEIRKTDSEVKKDDLEDKKDKVDKEINSEKEYKSENKDNKEDKKDVVKESESIKKYTGIIERNNERLSEIMESSNFHRSEIQALNEEIENAEKYLSITRMYETASLVKDELYDEAAHMEDEIKPIVDKLNSKGYKVKYASPGHSKLRKKEDNEPDGVYYGKLYSDARIMFADKYDFTAPKYWMHRDVDNCSYLDIIPVKYDKKDGSPDEAFAKWKDNYMDSLRKFADNLKSGDNDEPKTEAAFDLIALGSMLGAGVIATVVSAYKKAKAEKKWKLRSEAMNVYPMKHKDCPDMSKLKRTKHQMSAFDGSKGKQVDDNNDNAPGNFVYTYTLNNTPVVIVTKEGQMYSSFIAKNIPPKYKNHIMYIYSYILLYKHQWMSKKIEEWLDTEIKENEKLEKENGGKIVDDSAHIKVGKTVDVKKESDESDLNDIYSSTKYMDDIVEDLLKSNGII